MKFNRNTIATIGFLLMGFGAVSAQNRVCGFDAMHEKALQNVPGARESLERFEEKYQTEMAQGVPNSRGGVRTVPCVVHIIQSSAVELVTMADVQSQIDVLNEDFRKILGTPGAGNGVDMELEFCLASIDPNGCATDGVNRVVAPALAYHDQADAAVMKGLIQWDPHKYLNIWVPRTIETSSSSGQVIGYATFPNFLPFQPNLDGVVIHSGYFGRTADPTTIGRTTTHEVGHWIGLYHTFQNGCQGSSSTTCLSGGDRVCDTPQAFDANFGCPNINSCTDTPTDLPDQIENYMDYSDGTCQNMYTAGQKARADQLLNNYRSVLTSAANLTATGCDGSAAPGCTPNADFTASNIYTCPGEAVTFTDISYGAPTQWNWTFQGGTPGTSTSANPTVVFNAPGIYNVTLSVANALGTNTEVKTAYVNVAAPSNPPIVESFESVLNIPVGWSTEDEDQIGTWTLVSNAGSQGTKSLKVKNFDTDSEGSEDNLNLPAINLDSAQSAWLTYDYSYKRKSGFTFDTLQVNVSTDCGNTWTNLRTRSSISLVTVAGFSTAAEFVPTMASQWKTDTINLDSFAGMPSVKIQFKVIGYNGQSIYLDNVNLDFEEIMIGVNDPKHNAWDLTVSPNPFRDVLTVNYTLSKPGSTRFTLIDAHGKTIYSHQTPKQGAGSYSVAVAQESIRNLPAGLYFLKGEGPQGTITRKLVHMAE